jgi:hypothetical protein
MQAREHAPAATSNRAAGATDGAVAITADALTISLLLMPSPRLRAAMATLPVMQGALGRLPA